MTKVIALRGRRVRGLVDRKAGWSFLTFLHHCATTLASAQTDHFVILSVSLLLS
jgi:hypothetical protein